MKENSQRLFKYNPLKHDRQSIRLQGYDYSKPGIYYVTICTHKRMQLLGTIENGKMKLYDGGKIAHECWCNIPSHFPNVRLHEFILMPDHIHGIIEIVGAESQSGDGAENQSGDGAENFPPQQVGFQSLETFSKPGPSSKNLSAIIRGFKIGVTKWYRNNTNVKTIWQRNFWDEIILSEKRYNQIREYIRNNPSKWKS